MAKIYAWTVIKVLQIYPKSILAVVSEIEDGKAPHLLRQDVRFGCTEMDECSIIPAKESDGHPVKFEKPNGKKIKLSIDTEYGVLICSQGFGHRAQKIIKGNSKNVLYIALGRSDLSSIRLPVLKHFDRRQTKRRAI